MKLNSKLEEDREYADPETGLEMKVAKLAQVVEILLDHAPQQAKLRVGEILGD